MSSESGENILHDTFQELADSDVEQQRRVITPSPTEEQMLEVKMAGLDFYQTSHSNASESRESSVHINDFSSEITIDKTHQPLTSKNAVPPLCPIQAEQADKSLQQVNTERRKAGTLLGSAQFGKVYALLHQEFDKETAIKVISLDSFSGEIQVLRSELAILQSINHPGVIKVKKVFKTVDNIYIALEKMNGDMLKKILSQPQCRLPEDATKFLISQVVCAVSHLHSRGIVHCDLKPENVLLSDFHSSYPQIKLCDFGKARYIEDSQLLRRAPVRPGYSAPEMVSKGAYSGALDMWSLGVIIYVSLCGKFPFNDREDFAVQLERADVLFPSDPWSRLSRNAVDIIQGLLKIQIRQRQTIDECARHGWLQDAEVYSQLLKLERRIGEGRYLTSKEGDLRFLTEP